MPNISFHCPLCNYPINAPAEWAGQTLACPGCKKSISIPAAAEDDGPRAYTGRRQQGPAGPTPIFVAPEAPVPVAPVPLESLKEKLSKVLRNPNFKIGIWASLALLLIILGICVLLFFRHFRMCGENMQQYADALKRFEIANGRAPWDLMQFEKYLGTMLQCPAHKKQISYQLVPMGQVQVKRKMSNAGEIPVLICVHGFRAQVCYADGHVDVVKGRKKIKDLLHPVKTDN